MQRALGLEAIEDLELERKRLEREGRETTLVVATLSALRALRRRLRHGLTHSVRRGPGGDGDVASPVFLWIAEVNMDHSRTLAFGFLLLLCGCTTTVVQAPTPLADGGAAVDDGGVAPADPAAIDAAACITAGSNCRGSADACCNGTTCVFDTTDPSKAVCATTCLKDSQCNSGCCKVLIEGTSAVCAPAKYCAGNCSQPGQDCRTQACCANATCVVSTVTGTSCAARCAVGSQCVSGCCAPLRNTGELVCSPATFCQ